MRLLKRKYLECIATRVEPDDYSYYLTKYNNSNEKYEKYKLIPTNTLRE